MSNLYEKIIQLRKLARETERKRDELIEAIPDTASDEEFDELIDRYYDEYDATSIWAAVYAYGYHECKNSWFKSFVESFGICDSKRISEKQAAIIVKYGEHSHEHETGYGSKYYVRVGNLFVKATVFSGFGYVTIEELKY